MASLTSESQQPWLIRFKCRTMDEIVGHKYKKLVIEKWIEKNDMPNMIFYGEPTGKTSMATIVSGLYAPHNSLFYSSYEDRTPPGIKKNLEPFIASKTSVDKVIIIDDFENVVHNSQIFILSLIKKYPKCKWIITCRFLEQVSENLQRYFQLFPFEKLSIDDISSRIKFIADTFEVKMDNETLSSLIHFSNNDLISCINNFQNMYFYDKKFTVITLSQIIDMPIQQILRGMMFYLKSKNYVALWNLIQNMELSGIHVQDWVKYLDSWLEILDLADDDKLDMYTRVVKMNIDILEGRDSSEHFFIRLTEPGDISRPGYMTDILKTTTP